MVILTSVQHARISKAVNALRSAQATAAECPGKGPVNAAAQAVIDRLDASKSTLNADIEDAAPGIFSAAQKKAIFVAAVILWAEIEGAA